MSKRSVYYDTFAVHNVYFCKQITGNLKLPNLCLAVCILMQKSVILNTCTAGLV